MYKEQPLAAEQVFRFVKCVLGMAVKIGPWLLVCALDDATVCFSTYIDIKTAAMQSVSTNPTCPWLGVCASLYVQNIPQVIGWASGNSTVHFDMYKICMERCSFRSRWYFLSPAEIPGAVSYQNMEY